METVNKNLFKSICVVIAFLAVLFFALNAQNGKQNTSPTEIKGVSIAGQNVKVELATTEPEQAQGLSGRSGLEENQGMLFIFDHSDKYNFWMKDMNFPIDIIWINEDMQIVYIKKNALPGSYPEQYGPQDNAKYILEVSSGFSDKNNLQVGDSTSFTF